MNILQKVCRSRRGFNLVEMMVALGLMGIFLLLAGQVFVFTVGTFHRAGRHLNNMAISEAAFTRLRSDVWTANRLKVVHQQTLLCEYGQGRRLRWVEWTVEPHGQIRRLTSSGRKDHWPGRPRKRTIRVQFKLLPGALDLGLTWKGGHRLRVFPTQYMLLAGNSKPEGHQ